jgi:hypothetical protein
MRLEDIEQEVYTSIAALRVTPRRVALMKGVSSQLIIDDFGVIVCCINRLDYAMVDSKVTKDYDGWEVVYVSTSDNMAEKRDEILWALIRGGYIRWLRNVLSDSQFKNLIMFNNLGEKIIKKRLEIWGDKPKYRYFIEDHKAVLRFGFQREFADDPGFFDWLPEERSD